MEEMQAYLEKAGLELVSVQDADTLMEATEETERVYMIARENGK